VKKAITRMIGLGMNEPISRRDFLNGTILAGAGLLLGGGLPDAISRRRVERLRRRRRLSPLQRQHLGRDDAAHAMRDGTFERRIAGASDTGEMYDMVAVGGGISGLAAAVFFQKNKGGRCLVLDNHPIFGGEAKRNEFLVDGQSVVAHQGSAIFLVPKKGGYTDAFYNLIGMDRSAFNYQSWRGPSPEMPLATARTTRRRTTASTSDRSSANVPACG
jgi:spermidine dehydrogenase